MKNLRIYLLKMRLRAAYRAYMAAASDLDCGASMAETIRPEAAALQWPA